MSRVDNIDPSKLKRITIHVNDDIEVIRKRIFDDTGVNMTYVQTFDFLIKFYMDRANEPKTRFATLGATSAEFKPRTGRSK